jgi:NAD(P)H-dependent flavin oxidoreductase YrpB (nitropropane dioxygenase family)
MFKNKVAKEMMRIERENWNDFDFSMIKHLISGERGREAERTGDPDGGQWSAGQGIGLIEDTPSVAEAMRRLISEGEFTIQERLSGLMLPEAALTRPRL